MGWTEGTLWSLRGNLRGPEYWTEGGGDGQTSEGILEVPNIELKEEVTDGPGREFWRCQILEHRCDLQDMRFSYRRI